MNRGCLIFAIALALSHIATALPTPLVRSAVASNTTSRCISREVSSLAHALAPFIQHS
jgi:hypothetical protein